MYRLDTPAGPYESPTMLGLVILVLTHRTLHFLRGQGWTD